MTDDPRAHLDDEALSAVLDGAATEDEARHVADCSACSARVDALRAVVSAIGGAVPTLDPARLDAAVAAALSAQNVVPLSAARSARRPATWLGAAAAVVAVLTVGGLLGRAADDDADRDQIAADSGGDDAEAATGAAEESASDEMMTMDSDAAADSAAGSSLAGTDLGELRGADLQGLVVERQAQRAAEPSPTTVTAEAESGGATSASPAPPAPCEPELRAADPSLGAVTFTGSGTWDGQPVVVVVFEAGDEQRAFVVAVDGCAVRSTEAWAA